MTDATGRNTGKCKGDVVHTHTFACNERNELADAFLYSFLGIFRNFGVGG